MVHLCYIFALVKTIIAMERIQLEPGYIQLFPRTFEHGLHPAHVENSDFVAECRYVEGFGDVWLLHQQKPPHLVAHVQFATDEVDFDKKLGTAIGLQKLHEYITDDLTFFCMLAGINAAEIPPTWPDRIKIPVCALQEATCWWYEYRHEALANK
jgi:hypothetical protein